MLKDAWREACFTLAENLLRLLRSNDVKHVYKKVLQFLLQRHRVGYCLCDVRQSVSSVHLANVVSIVDEPHNFMGAK
jgi:hypothetical protein